jgi:hypothetical protein
MRGKRVSIPEGEWLAERCALTVAGGEAVALAMKIRSAYVVLIPWCNCCEARVPVDHLCECESHE